MTDSRWLAVTSSAMAVHWLSSVNQLGRGGKVDFHFAELDDLLRDIVDDSDVVSG